MPSFPVHYSLNTVISLLLLTWATANAAFNARVVLAKPTDIPGCQIWLNPSSGFYSDAGTTPAAALEKIQQWNDASGNENHVSQSESANRPILGFDNYAYFTSNNWHTISAFLTLPPVPINTRNFTMFFAARFRYETPSQALWSATNVSYGFFPQEDFLGPGLANVKFYKGGTMTGTGIKSRAGECVYVFGGSASGMTVAQNSEYAYPTALANMDFNGGFLGRWNAQRYAAIAMKEFILYSRYLSASEISAVKRYLEYRHSTPPFAHTKQAVTDGDSLTSGSRADYLMSYQNHLAKSLDQYWKILNYGIASQTIATMSNNAAANIDSTFDASLLQNVCVGWGGSNDMALGGTCSGTNTYLIYKGYGNDRKAAGFKFVAVTVLPRVANCATFESERQIFNTLVRNDSSFYDALADIGNDPVIGEPGDHTNPIYYADNVHLTSAGYAIVSQYVYDAIQSIP